MREGEKNNNNRLWKGDKLRNKECIHERERERGEAESEREAEGR